MDGATDAAKRVDAVFTRAGSDGALVEVFDLAKGYFSEGRVDVGVNREVAGEAKVMNKTVLPRDLFGDEA